MKRPMIVLASTLFVVACTGVGLQAATAPAPAPAPAAVPDPKAADASGTASADALLRPAFHECVDAAEGVTPAIQACIETEYDYQQSRLDVAVRHRVSTLKGHDLGAFGAEQDRWKRWRESACGWNAEEQGQGQRLEANLCYLNATAKRAKELRAP